MINFRPIALSDREHYEKFLFNGETRGCEFSFANLYMWGNVTTATIGDYMVFFAQYNGVNVYPFPQGSGDKKPVFDAIIEDAKIRNIPCRISGVLPSEQKILEELYPRKFQFYYNRDSFDYVYQIDDLADLGGRKYHRKRNHLHRFHDSFPNYTVEPLNAENLPAVRQMVDEWYSQRLSERPDSDFLLEKLALEKAFSQYSEIGLDRLVLLDADRVLAFTMGSRLSNDTFDIHFEKARADVEGAYTAINCEFAKFLRNKYPEIRFLDREEDMGLEGLRKAKESYNPHHLVEKCFATFLED